MRIPPISVVTPDEKGVIVVYQCVAMAREGRVVCSPALKCGSSSLYGGSAVTLGDIVSAFSPPQEFRNKSTRIFPGF